MISSVLHPVLPSHDRAKDARKENDKLGHTSLINIILADPDLLLKRRRPDRWIFRYGPEALRHQHKLIARDMVGSDGFGDDTLGVAIGIVIRGIPLCSVS